MDATTTPSITMQPVTSSQLDSVGHDPATKTLAVRFKAKGSTPGSLYHYDNVTPEHFAEMMAAESVNSHFIHNVKKKPEAHPYRKISEAVLG